ncbi:MAG: helix-turn-helix domain-containing protein [Actinomycetaceae bacterium]|nr:helix-turn-helix domain-containing protein [Actinomycetaceae bacterium]
MAPRFLTLADVAEQLQISTAAVRNLVNSGELRAIQIGGRGLWRVEEAAFQEFIDTQYAASQKKVTDGIAVTD